MDQSHLRSPLAKARGLGAAKEGVGHWWAMRVTSIALVPLSVWFMIVLVGKLGTASRVEVADWLSSPYVALLLLAFLLTLIVHCRLGLKEIIEDYIHKECVKIFAILLNNFVAFGLAVAVLFAIARLHFIGI